LRRRLTGLALSQRLQGWRESKVTIWERKADFRIEQRFSSGLPLSVDIATDQNRVLSRRLRTDYCSKVVADGVAQRRVSMVVLGFNPLARKVQHSSSVEQ
jgi:hypothetical protein